MATAQRSADSIQKNVSHLASIPRKISKDAIALLKTDHAAVKRCFEDYQNLVKTDASASKKNFWQARFAAFYKIMRTLKRKFFTLLRVRFWQMMQILLMKLMWRTPVPKI